jgi:hypothetical protein
MRGEDWKEGRDENDQRGMEKIGAAQRERERRDGGVLDFFFFF